MDPLWEDQGMDGIYTSPYQILYERQCSTVMAASEHSI